MVPGIHRCGSGSNNSGLRRRSHKNRGLLRSMVSIIPYCPMTTAMRYAASATCVLLVLAWQYEGMDALPPDGHGSLFNNMFLPKSHLKVDRIPPPIAATTVAKSINNHVTNDTLNSQPETIAYAVSLTSCGGAFNDTSVDPNANPFQIAEGAAVLAHSIHMSSFRGANSGLGGRYDYELIALYHPDAAPCVGVLKDLGYKLVQREIFIKVEEIEGDFLRESIPTSGCCGEKELIKMEAYTLLEYALVLILDMDCLVLKPLDTLFDYMLHGIAPPLDHLQWPNKKLPINPSLLYTLDYAMVAPQRRIKPMQGGFLLIRPDMGVYEELRALVRKGDYRKHGGWAGKTGKYWGGQTVQGLLAYYYLLLNGGENSTSVELNRCIYNNMASKPQTGTGECFVAEEPCRDCREQPVSLVRSAHFTVCLKPWNCQRSMGGDRPKLCRELHHEWFRMRSAMETGWGRSGIGRASKWSDIDQFLGYCKSAGSKGYLPIETPYHPPRSSA